VVDAESSDRAAKSHWETESSNLAVGQSSQVCSGPRIEVTIVGHERTIHAGRQCAASSVEDLRDQEARLALAPRATGL
jgi:hypothetical protein